jgi:cell division protein FtsB
MKNRRFFIILGIILFFLLQYSLWFSQNGLVSSHHLTQLMSALKAKNKALFDQNNGLKNDIFTLEHDPNVISKKARENFGMIKPGETYYDIVGSASDDAHV